ncbi:putative invertase inhibitor [Aristolochia californica]|uniref:putative invertase inhibitor n=1 Tax=Aristolochia californica TaxID=171875 RepID=UPI0035DA55E5
MSYHPNLLLLLLTLSISLQGHILLASDTEAGIGFIQFTCKQTSEYDLCVSILESDPTSLTADLKGVLTNALKVTTAYAADLATNVTELTRTTQDPFLLQFYTDCSEHYMDAVDQIDDSVVALDSKGYSDVNAWVNAAIADAESCEAGFSQKAGFKSTISDQSEHFEKLCRIILDITKALAG